MKKARLMWAVLLLVAPLCGQTIGITGNSIAVMMGGFQSDLWPQLPSGNITIFGQYSETCHYLYGQIPYFVPADTDVIVLFDATNDVRTGVSVPQHVACMQATILELWQRNNAVKIVIANVPPWVEGFYNQDGQWIQQGCTGYYDARSVIAMYNAAYASTNWNANVSPNTVSVLDVWTPNVLSSGFANPLYMTGSCGVHPGPANDWVPGWPHFTQPMVALVNSLLGIE